MNLLHILPGEPSPLRDKESSNTIDYFKIFLTTRRCRKKWIRKARNNKTYNDKTYNDKTYNDKTYNHNLITHTYPVSS